MVISVVHVVHSLILLFTDIESQQVFQRWFSQGGDHFLGIIISPYNVTNKEPNSEIRCFTIGTRVSSANVKHHSKCLLHEQPQAQRWNKWRSRAFRAFIWCDGQTCSIDIPCVHIIIGQLLCNNQSESSVFHSESAIKLFQCA